MRAGSAGKRVVYPGLTSLLRRLGYRASLHLLDDRHFLKYTNDSRNQAQVVSGGWTADYPSPSTFIGKLSCGYFIPRSASIAHPSPDTHTFAAGVRALQSELAAEVRVPSDSRPPPRRAPLRIRSITQRTA